MLIQRDAFEKFDARLICLDLSLNMNLKQRMVGRKLTKRNWQSTSVIWLEIHQEYIPTSWLV
jgi:hypothetical protein